MSTSNLLASYSSQSESTLGSISHQKENTMSHRPFQFVASILSATFLIASVGCGTYGLDPFEKGQSGEELCAQEADEYWDSVKMGLLDPMCVTYEYVEGDTTQKSASAIAVVGFVAAAARANVHIDEGDSCQVVPAEDASDACHCAGQVTTGIALIEEARQDFEEEEWFDEYVTCVSESTRREYHRCLCRNTGGTDESCNETYGEYLSCEDISSSESSEPAGPPPPGMESDDSSGAFTMSVQVSPTEIDSQPLSTDDLIEHLTGPSALGVYWAPGTDGAAYQGVYLSYLNASSPLRQMGLRSQDVVTHLNGIKVNNDEALVSALSLVHENSVARMRILREDEVLRVRYDFR